jgi:hypothetical protein
VTTHRDRGCSAWTISILQRVRRGRLSVTGQRAGVRRTEIPSAAGISRGCGALRRATVPAVRPSSPTPKEVTVSAHAVEQYRDRVKPGLDSDAARTELEQLCALGLIQTEAPGWVNPARPAAYYLLLADQIVLPLAPQADTWVATTCVAQRTLTPTRRAAKSARKASLAARKRALRKTRR